MWPAPRSSGLFSLKGTLHMKKAKEPKDAIAFQIRNLALGLGLGLAASVGLAAGTFDGPFVHLGSNLANSQEDVSNLVGPGTTKTSLEFKTA